MSNLKPIQQISWKCPCCNLFEDSSKDVVAEHIKTCSYNPTLPKRDCPNCRHWDTITTKQRCGRANHGKRDTRPLLDVTIPVCKKGVSKTVHAGYNGCYYFEGR